MYEFEPERKKMGKEVLSCAKINRPEFPSITYRERLFDSLGECRNCPGVWLSGPAGSGKTALISSYVEARGLPFLWYSIDSADSDPAAFFHTLGLAVRAVRKASLSVEPLPVFNSDQQQSISQFCHYFFTMLFAQLERPSILVLDNYQEIAEESVLHDLVIESFNRMPEGFQVVFISRHEPSSKFSRLKANQMIHALGWEDIRFSFEEYNGVVELLGLQVISERKLRSIYEITGGWITGLLFLLQETEKNPSDSFDREKGSCEEILFYLEEEAFCYQELQIQHFLLKTSLLPFITNDLAMKLTGNSKAKNILFNLSRYNLFTEKQIVSGKTVYRYHRLFREFLHSMLPDFFAAEELMEIKNMAAKILHQSDQPEEAAELFRSAGDLDSFINVAVQHAPVLLSKGKYKVLEDWFSAIPKEKFTTNPWLYAWYGAVFHSTSPRKARKNFRKAFREFAAQKNLNGTYVSWNGLIHSIISEWHDFAMLDPLIDWLEANYDHEAENLPAELKGEVAASMVEALMIRRPQSDEIKKWVNLSITYTEYAKNIDRKINAQLTAADYHHWLGEHGYFEILLEKAMTLSLSQEISPSTLLKIKLMEAGMYAWHKAEEKKCLQIVEDALEIEQVATHHASEHMLYFMGMCSAVIAGDLAKAEGYHLKSKAQCDNSRRFCAFSNHYMAAWLNFLRGEKTAAVQHAMEALGKASEAGYVFYEALASIAVARTLAAKGEYGNASVQLERFGNIARTTSSKIFNYMYFLEKANFSFDQKREGEGRDNLRAALEIGRQQNYMNMMCWWDASAMTRLCVKAMEEDIETEFVKKLIAKRALIPAFPPIEIEQWPWPLRIYTLGRFEIVKNGKPLRFAGKAQQKPLNMLKALIAFGGRKVSEFHLGEALWPESDGDMQHQSIATTLHRLRRIVGNKEFVKFRNGHLSLDARYCWVDAWAFERLLSRAEAEAGGEDDEDSAVSAAWCAEKAISLYKGDFLPQLNREPWCINKKERLKSRFLRGVIFLGRKLEQSGEWEKAVTHYLKALDIEPLMEELYQRLMIYHQSQGRYADAVLLYQRCRKNFETFLNVQPSQQTDSLYRSILYRSGKGRGSQD